VDHRFEACGNCGGPVTRSEDGRSVSCSYCGARDAVALDPRRLAAALRTDLASLEVFLEKVTESLAASFPDHTTVSTKGGLFSKKTVHVMELRVDDGLYRLRRERADVVAERVHVVRGITLKTERLAPGEWLDALCGALAEMAAENASARAALKRLGTT